MSGMFKKFLNVVAEVVAPTEVSQLEDFKKAWNGLNTYFREQMDDQTPVEATSIPVRLRTMLDILLREDEKLGRDASEDGSTAAGPCMEYLMEQRILGQLVSLGKADFPPGMRRLTLSFFGDLLAYCEQPLIPQVGFHDPLLKLIEYCYEKPEYRSTDEYVNVLLEVCRAIEEKPFFMRFFERSISPTEGTMNLVAGVIANVGAQSNVGERARDALAIIIALHDDFVTNNIEASSLSQVLADTTATLYAMLPTSLEESGSGEESEDEHGWIVGSDPSGASTKTDPLKALCSFVEYMDGLIDVAPKSIGSVICEVFSRVFLVPSLQPNLLSGQESVSHAATVYTTAILQCIQSPLFLWTFLTFLLGEDDTTPDVRGKKGHPLRDTLIKRMNSLNEEISLASMELFCTILGSYNMKALANLVLRNLSGVAAVVHAATSDTSSMHSAVERFLGLVPVRDVTGSGYDRYLLDAHGEIAVRNEATRFWSPVGLGAAGGGFGPRSLEASASAAFGGDEEGENVGSSNTTGATSTTSDTSEGAGQEANYEGLFLEVLLNRLQAFFESPLDGNIMLTGVFACLLRYPHPLVHAFLLDAGPPGRTLGGMRTLFSVLSELTDSAAIRAQRVKDFDTRLAATRRSMAVGEVGVNPQLSRADESHGGDDATTFLEALVVIEEFSKEIAAVLHALATS